MEQVIKVWFLGRPKKEPKGKPWKQGESRTGKQDDARPLLSTRKHTLARVGLTSLLLIACAIGTTRAMDNDPSRRKRYGYQKHTGSMGPGTNITLLTMALHNDEPYKIEEWGWDNTSRLHRLWGETGQEIKVVSWMVNGSLFEKVTQISVTNIETHEKHSRSCISERWDCWHNFTLIQPVFVVCLWSRNDQGRSFKFRIDLIKQQTTTILPTSTFPKSPTTTEKIENVLSPQIYEIGPYAIKKTGQQQVLFNPTWSLKRVELSMQANISAIKSTCTPFLSVSYAGWLTWLHRRTPAQAKRTRRDVTGIMGTGLGVLNSIDAEMLMNKLSTATSDLYALQHPLQSSLSALGTSQWVLSDVLPQWEKTNMKDHQLIVDALAATQNDTSLALSCIQAQIWMQFMVAAIVREGEAGTLPAEIRKVIWDKANEFEKKFQSWWHLVNFTYDPVTNYATAFVLTIRNASVYTIYPIIALGLNHDGVILYPIEHREWAWKKGKKWRTVDVSSCAVREQRGFVCEGNTPRAQDICLDTEQNICHFEVHPNEIPETVLVYIGDGCVCMRTPCNSILVDDITMNTGNHSNLCICNFTNIVGCDFNYTAPVTSFQLLRSNYTLIQDLLPTPIGMDLDLVRKLLRHDDLYQLLQRIRNNGQKTLITVHHDMREIHRVLERIKKDGEHHWWEVLLGWSPTARGVFNAILHPIVIILALTVVCLVLVGILYVRLWHMQRRLRHMIDHRVEYLKIRERL